MLFAINYRWRANTTSRDTQRTRRLFVAWEPPPGLDKQIHYYYARGGGILIVQAASATVLYEALVPFTPTIEFDIEPVINVIDAIAISMDVDEWAHEVLSDDHQGAARIDRE